jgi:N-methylhydantoinase B
MLPTMISPVRPVERQSAALVSCRMPDCHPFDREPERVLADVRAGFVSAASAEADYGIVLNPNLTVDAVATGRRRERRPPVGLFYRGGYRDRLD